MHPSTPPSKSVRPSEAPPASSRGGPTTFEGSPYRANIVEIVQRFGTTWERRQYLRGLLGYRHAYYAIGVFAGYQWLAGWCLRDADAGPALHNAANALRVITFAPLGDMVRQTQLLHSFPHLFSPNATIASFGIDAHFVNLDSPLDESNVALVNYWHSICSPRRADGVAQGFAQIPVEGSLDRDATAFLQSLDPQGAPR